MTGLEMFFADKTAGIFFFIFMIILCVAFFILTLKDGF